MGEDNKNNGLDAASIIQRTGSRNRQLRAYSPLTEKQEETLQPVTEPPIEATAPLPTTEPVREQEPLREESKRRKNKMQDYESLFFKDSAVKTRSGKVVYIRKEHHDRILKIVRVIGENEFSLFNYLDNVLEHHFNIYQDEITELYHRKNTDVF
jgi:hypothetical protein